MYTCKSGQHSWFEEEDANKCCNEFKRVLSVGSVPDTFRTYFSFRWEKCTHKNTHVRVDDKTTKCYRCMTEIKCTGSLK